MTVANNEFSRASYMPVRIKGVMPHGANYWQDNGVTEPTRDDYVYHVEFNHIYEYGEGILSDFGGIYMGKSTMRRQACHKNSRRFECRMATRGGTIPIPKNRNPGSMGYFGGIGTGIGIKGIVKGIKKELFSDSNFFFHEQAEGIAIHDS